MAITHTFVCAIADDATAAANGEVVPSNWNADHAVTNLVLTHGTIATDVNTLGATVTWNAAGVTFTGIKLNVTDTASASASKLLDLQVGGASIFSVFKEEGGFVSGSGNLFAKFSRVQTASYFGEAGVAWHLFIQRSSSRVSLAADTKFSWTNTNGSADATVDLTLNRDVADTLAQRRTTNAQTFRVYGTYTDDSNYVRASIASTSTTVTLAAETAGTGADNIDVTITPAGTGVVASASPIKTQSTTVGSLMSAATAGSGARAFVTDATATTFLSTVAGGGSNKVPVVSDGTNWLIG